MAWPIAIGGGEPAPRRCDAELADRAPFPRPSPPGRGRVDPRLYDDAAEAIRRATGVAVAKRQVEELARRSATDVEDFYDASETVGEAAKSV